MLKAILRLLALTILLVPPMVCLPAICWLLAAHHDPTAAEACVFFGPLSAGFWALVYSQWSSAHAWNRMGRLKQWRSDHGGFLRTIPRACGWLLFGIVASFFAEIAFMIAFKYVPYDMFDGEARLRLWLCLFPFACYAPLLAAWAWRRRHV